MKILNVATGATEYDANPITKSAGTIIIGTDKNFVDLDNELITVWIERNGGQNIYLATNVKLRDFIMASLSNQQTSVQGWHPTLKTIAVCELGFESGIKLNPNEKIHIKLTKCDALMKYDISYVESPTNTLSHVEFEYKSILAGEQEKSYDVNDYVMAVFAVPAELNEVGLTVNGQERRFTPFELTALMVEDYPEQRFVAVGEVYQTFENVLVLPLVGIETFTFYKSTAGEVGLTLMKYGELVPAGLGGVKKALSAPLGSASFSTSKRI